MPYTVRKQKCRQSDGDSGGYVLSYTDDKGKKHRACHTSRKKAKGQIAAIEAESAEATSGTPQISESGENKMNITVSELRRIIREVLAEKREDDDRDDDGDKDFADVMMARMTAGGVSKKKAVKKTRKYDE